MIDKMKKTVYDYNISTRSVHSMLEKKHQKMQIVVLDFFLQTTVPDKLCKLFSTKNSLASIKGEAQRNSINQKEEEWEFLKENKIIIYLDIVS